MELTPQALHDVEFREARRGGYNTRDVDDFLERVAIGIGQQHDRLREAYHRAEAAEGRLAEMQRQLEDAQRRSPDGPSDADETLRRTLVLAQRTADATIKEAQDEANRLLSEAQGEAAHTRASAETDAMRDAKAEVEQLMATRDTLMHDIEALEHHVEEQRGRIRGGIEQMRQLLDDPSTLRTSPPPNVADVTPPVRHESPFGHDLPSNGRLTANGDSSREPLPAPAPPPVPAPAPSLGGHNDGSMVAALQELPRREPRDPVLDPGPPTEPISWPSQLPSRPIGGAEADGAAPTIPSASPAGATAGFLPDLRSAFEPPEPPGSKGAPDPLDDLPLPIDAPPPPPPPPALDHLHDVGGIPIEPGSRPSEWGRGVFDTEEDASNPARFGRRG